MYEPLIGAFLTVFGPHIVVGSLAGIFLIVESLIERLKNDKYI